MDFIDEHRNEDYFLYLHIMDTHFPHSFGEDAQRYYGSKEYDGPLPADFGGRVPDSHALNADDLRYINAIYDDSLREADRQIEKLVEHLKKSGLFDDTLIVITADHGEHLFEAPDRTTHGGHWYESVARIPLIISYPSRVAASRFESFSELVDIAPTMMGLLGAMWPPGKQPDGIDLAAVARGERAGRKLAASPHGLRTEQYKILFEDGDALLEGGKQVASGQLFLMDEDPDEQREQWRSHPEIVSQLTAQYREIMLPGYQRFVSAVNHDQPESPFAISARDIHLSAPSQTVEYDANLSSFGDVGPEQGWLRSKFWADSWLLAPMNSGASEISFPLPNGRYEVAFFMRGRAEISLAGGTAVGVEGPELKRLSPGSMEFVQLGTADVGNEEFRAHIKPSAESWFMLGMIGMRPVAVGANRAAQVDADHVDRLRALGYIE
jgi:hypothetical protein